MNTGEVKAEYGANWFGCYALFDHLVKAKIGDISAYQSAMIKAKDFLLQFPMKTGYWTDGHTDTDVNSHTYKSNMSASNATLYIVGHPEFDPSPFLPLIFIHTFYFELIIFMEAPFT